MSETGLSGHRFVLLLYGLLIAFAGVAGFLTGIVVSDLSPPAYLFLVEFPATPLGMAAYGALTVATVLGVPLALVIAVSEWTDAVDEST